MFDGNVDDGWKKVHQMFRLNNFRFFVFIKLFIFYIFLLFLLFCVFSVGFENMIQKP